MYLSCFVAISFKKSCRASTYNRLRNFLPLSPPRSVFQDGDIIYTIYVRTANSIIPSPAISGYSNVILGGRAVEFQKACHSKLSEWDRIAHRTVAV